VHVGSKAVVVRWRTGESMSVPIAHFGPAPRLKWSPGGLRFAVLESVRDRTVDRMLLVEPRQRRSLLVARTPRAIEIESAAFLTDDELIAQTFDAHQHARLTRFDAASGRIVSSRRSSLAVSLRMDWSPKAKRLLVEDPEGLVSVIGLDRPDRARGVKLTGAPSWSPDATRILAVPDEEAGESDSAQLATWPGAARVRLPELEDAQWEPAAATLIGVQGAIVLDGSTAVPRVVQVGADGRVTYVYPAQWPASSGGYFPTSIPTAIEAIEPDYVP
jgi:hypothetical protein